jgi:hypothetical protein
LTLRIREGSDEQFVLVAFGACGLPKVVKMRPFWDAPLPARGDLRGMLLVRRSRTLESLLRYFPNFTSLRPRF